MKTSIIVNKWPQIGQSTMQVISDSSKNQRFMKLVFDLLVAAMKADQNQPKGAQHD